MRNLPHGCAPDRPAHIAAKAPPTSAARQQRRRQTGGLRPRKAWQTECRTPQPPVPGKEKCPRPASRDIRAIGPEPDPRVDGPLWSALHTTDAHAELCRPIPRPPRPDLLGVRRSNDGPCPQSRARMGLFRGEGGGGIWTRPEPGDRQGENRLTFSKKPRSHEAAAVPRRVQGAALPSPATKARSARI